MGRSVNVIFSSSHMNYFVSCVHVLYSVLLHWDLEFWGCVFCGGGSHVVRILGFLSYLVVTCIGSALVA